jgi:RNA polymerase sigma factor (sigma-70 family)
MPFSAPIARALLRSQSDERLVRLARDDHKGAFDEIVRRYRTPLVAFAAAYAPADRAEDVVQEGLANAWASLKRSDREIALKPWLYAIVRNGALNARRDARYHSELDETIDGVPRPDQIVLERDELNRAVAAIAMLPDAQRKALVESAIEGRTHDQIAAELATSPASVRGLIHRGRVAVRGAVGALVPFPIVAWAAGSGGTVAGSVAAGSALGGSIAAKGIAVATIAVLATGSGIVVERSLNDSARTDREAGAAETGKEQGKSGSGQGRHRDGDEAGEENGGPAGGREADGSRGEGESKNGGDSSGGDDNGGDNEDNSGHGGGDDNSGHGGGDDDSEPDDDNSGPGGGDDDSEPDDHSGSGGGDDDSEPDDNSSGSGSDDDSHSDSDDDDDSSGSSGSGSDDDEPDDD